MLLQVGAAGADRCCSAADRTRLAGISSPPEFTLQRFGRIGERLWVEWTAGQPETCPCVGENRIVDCWQEASTAGAGAKTPPTIDCRNDIALHRDFMKGLVVLGEGWATYAWSFGMRASRANHSFKFAALPVTVAWAHHVPECWPASSGRDPTTRVRRRDRERCSSSNIADNLAFGIWSYRAIRFPVTCRYPQRVVRE